MYRKFDISNVSKVRYIECIESSICRFRYIEAFDTTSNTTTTRTGGASLGGGERLGKQKNKNRFSTTTSAAVVSCFRKKEKGNNQIRVYPVRLVSKTGTPWNQAKNTPHEPRDWPKTNRARFRDDPGPPANALLCLAFNRFWLLFFFFTIFLYIVCIVVNCSLSLIHI